MRFDGVADRNAAEALKGRQLFVPRDALPAPDADEFYHADLIGLAGRGFIAAPHSAACARCTISARAM